MDLPRPVEHSIVEWLATVVAGGSDVGPINPVSEALARMFQALLTGSASWSEYWWIDDALPQRAKRVDDTTVEVAGIFVPADETHQWIQPFAATFRTDSDRSRLVGYRISLADADLRIDSVPWGARQPASWPDITRWAYMFSEAD